MTETIIAFLFAHALADFGIVSRRWTSDGTSFLLLSLHIGVLTGLCFVALGFTGLWPVLIILGLHLLMDFIATYFLPRKLWSFAVEQIVHIVTILAVASQFPDTFASGIWGDYSFWESGPVWIETIPQVWVDSLPLIMLLGGGFILATKAGGAVIGLLLEQLPEKPAAGMARAGRISGNLERALGYILVVAGLPLVFGFVVLGKFIWLFGTAQQDRAAAETLLIGTLASFGWAILVAFGTISMRGLLD